MIRKLSSIAILWRQCSLLHQMILLLNHPVLTFLQVQSWHVGTIWLFIMILFIHLVIIHGLIRKEITGMWTNMTEFLTVINWPLWVEINSLLWSFSLRNLLLLNKTVVFRVGPTHETILSKLRLLHLPILHLIRVSHHLGRWITCWWLWWVLFLSFLLSL